MTEDRVREAVEDADFEPSAVGLVDYLGMR